MNSQDAGGVSLPILQGPTKHKDPVCGMTVAPEKAAGKVEHAGKTYYFCSKRCAERFSGEPKKFLAALGDRKSTRLNSSHTVISYAVFCLKKKKSIRQLKTPKSYRA